MRKTALVIAAAASIGLGGTVGAVAQPHVASKAHKVHAKVSPSKPKPGTTTTTKATGGLKNKDYYCILSLNKKGINLQNLGAAGSDTLSIQTVHSNSKGKIKCQQVFTKFSGKYGGKKHSCPPTKADKRAGWGCGVGLADVKTRGKKSVGVAAFKF